MPLLYDRAAVDEGYIGELIVVCPAYVVLGLLIIKGKELLVELREQAEALALLDPLTDLPNRRAMLEWLTAETLRESRTGLLLVDLDGFKDVNTAHGYPAGDAVLRETAERLRHCVRTDDMVARLGGDEFAVLAPSATPHAMRAARGARPAGAARPRARGHPRHGEHRLGALPGRRALRRRADRRGRLLPARCEADRQGPRGVGARLGAGRATSRLAA